MFDINNFVIDRPIRGTMFSTDDNSVLWSVTQIEDPSITVNADTTDAVDAIGVPIMSFDRAKNAEFSASNSLLDLDLLAAQSGTAKKKAAVAATLTVPRSQEVEWVTGTDVDLDFTPVGTAGAEIPFIYVLNGDGSLGTRYEAAAAAAAGKFKVNAATKKITPPTDVATREKVWIYYEYVADGTTDHGAVQVDNDANNFPSAGRFVMQVLGHDTCNISKKYIGHLIFPQAKLTSDFDLTLSTDGKHPFTLKAMQEYCSYEKRLFSLIVPET